VPCEGGILPFTPQQIRAYLPQIDPEWQVVNQIKLVRGFKFKNFVAAIKFVNQVAEIAEAEGHHPNIHLTNWNQVTLKLYTHKIGGLHENDFILAAKIDSLYSRQQ
jgi:4a-hydroxytetrahydrobiopterin dehydratase